MTLGTSYVLMDGPGEKWTSIPLVYWQHFKVSQRRFITPPPPSPERFTHYSHLLVHSEIYLSSGPFTKGRRLFQPGSASDKQRSGGSARADISLQVPADLLTHRHGDTTITEATRTVMEKWGLGGFKFVLGETKNVYEEKRKARERDKVCVRTMCACACVCKGESGRNKMPFLSAWHTFSGTGSYITSQQRTTAILPALWNQQSAPSDQTNPRFINSHQVSQYSKFNVRIRLLILMFVYVVHMAMLILKLVQLEF